MSGAVTAVAVGVGIGAAVGGISAAINGGDIGMGILGGAVGGGLTGGIAGPLGGALGSSLGGAIGAGAIGGLAQAAITGGDPLQGALFGGAMGGLMQGVGANASAEPTSGVVMDAAPNASGLSQAEAVGLGSASGNVTGTNAATGGVTTAYQNMPTGQFYDMPNAGAVPSGASTVLGEGLATPSVVRSGLADGTYGSPDGFAGYSSPYAPVDAGGGLGYGTSPAAPTSGDTSWSSDVMHGLNDGSLHISNGQLYTANGNLVSNGQYQGAGPQAFTGNPTAMQQVWGPANNSQNPFTRLAVSAENGIANSAYGTRADLGLSNYPNAQTYAGTHVAPNSYGSQTVLPTNQGVAAMPGATYGANPAAAAQPTSTWGKITNWVSNNPIPTAMGGLSLMSMVGKQQQPQQQVASADAPNDPYWNQGLIQYQYGNGSPNRPTYTPTPYQVAHAGYLPEFLFFDPNPPKAIAKAKTGGVIGMKKGGGLPDPKTSNPGGQDDVVPILGAQGEYMIPADVVSHLGDGYTDAGAKKLDQMVDHVRKHKGAKKGLPPRAKPQALDYARSA